MKVRRFWWLLPTIALCFSAHAIWIDAKEPTVEGFKDAPARDIVVTPFTDRAVNELVTTLDGLLAEDKDPAQWSADAGDYLWTFVERLQAGRLTSAQEARVLAHLDQLERQHPGDTALIERERHVLTALRVGKTAPDIQGKDLDGQPLKLSDYRGSVVVLAFSGEWCGACRAEYPYERLLLEVYKDRPLTILTVDSDSDPVLARNTKAARGLMFRSWWDGYGAKSTAGPIASAWGVVGWPTTYLIDEDGVIRFVNLRQEDLLKGVKQLMNELSDKETAARSRPRGR